MAEDDRSPVGRFLRVTFASAAHVTRWSFQINAGFKLQRIFMDPSVPEPTCAPGPPFAVQSAGSDL